MDILEFLKQNGFKITKHEESEYFGDYYYDLSNGVYELRIVSDKSIKAIEIKSLFQPNDKWYDNWYDIAMVKALLYNEEDLTKGMSYEEYEEFVRTELPAIDRMFSKENYTDTLREVDKLREKRAKQLFPEWYI